MDHIKLLNIKEVPVTGRLDYGYLFTIISDHVNYKDWIYSNYVNLFAAYDNHTLDFNFMDRGFDIPIIERKKMYLCDSKYANKMFEQFLTDLLIEKILNNYYIVLILDEYYVPNREAYGKHHMDHINLIFGFNSDERFFYSMGYDLEKQYKCTYISFSDLLLSFCNASTYRIEFMKSKKEFMYNFSFSCLYKNLKCYLYNTNINDYFMERIELDYVFTEFQYNIPRKYGYQAQNEILSYLNFIYEKNIL